jgi:cyclic beta-1,2-glucan synthetase
MVSGAAAVPCHALLGAHAAAVVTATGGGFSAFDDWLLTAWRPDPVEGRGGLALYVRDLATGEYWTISGAALPGQAPGRVFRRGPAVVIEREAHGVRSTVEVRLDAATGLELRRVVLANLSATARDLELTSFVEVALNHPEAHEGHPAFSKLFVQTRRVPGMPVLLATRRARSRGETSPVLGHALLDTPLEDFATDRARFLGRGRDDTAPAALATRMPLGGTAGNVLDPALCLRARIALASDGRRELRVALGAGADPDALVAALGSLAAPGAVSQEAPERTGTVVAELVGRLTRGLGPLAAATGRGLPRRVELPRSPSIPTGEPLAFWNGTGGFATGGREYVIRVAATGDGGHSRPPAPWTNVLANPTFGCLVSESGAGATWSGNSREWRVTPWHNDAVSDPHGDALYVRDAATGAFWSPTPGPAAPPADVEVRHGFGYTVWRTAVGGLDHETTVYVAPDEPVRVTRLALANRGSEPRRLEIYAYARIVLGGTPEATREHVSARWVAALEAIVAERRGAPAGLPSVAFAATDTPGVDAWCADRAAFLGVPGSASAPAALVEGRLPAVTGPEPCAVLCVCVDLAPGETRELSFLLGTADSEPEAAARIAAWRRPRRVEAGLAGARELWSGLVSRLEVATPSPALDLMLNGWLVYQDVACRLWARTAFYQSGGAFGFRDQLQDAASLVLLRPDLTRAQLLLHAAHQFVEGDVLHWWHPPLEAGLRTRFADDLLWLPWFAAYYVAVTGDRAVLSERVPYVTARKLADGEAEAYLKAEPAGTDGELYEHCCRALDRSLARGAHGLPFFGAGDWNDGMNRVGHAGRGESVWMGFFLVRVIEDFVPLCAARGDSERADRYRAHALALREALNADGWDGQWYRRGWYDDGTPLGSQASDECRIDALAQAWAVISGVAPPERAAAALDSLERHLVDDAARIVRLLTPPFVDTPNDPGYIRGYVAGVRENGGQYTHAAVWVVKAMAEAGRRTRAGELLEALLPVNHSLDAAAAGRYKVEPYVVAADVYGAEPHVGRGGWTWYTGSAGWLYRVAVETILGLAVADGATLTLRPRIPDNWDGFRIRYRIDDERTVEIDVRNPERRAERVVAVEPAGAARIVEGALHCPLPAGRWLRRLTVVLGA